MDGRMLLQLGWVAHNDAREALDDPTGERFKSHIARNDRRRPTEGDRREAARLAALADRLFYQALEKGMVCNGTDYAFGDEPQRYDGWE